MTTEYDEETFSPVLPDLNNVSKFDIAVDKAGQVFLVYTNELSSIPEYVEYDSEMNILSFIDDYGRLQNLGITLKNTSRQHLLNNHSIILVKINDDFTVNSHKTIQLLTR